MRVRPPSRPAMFAVVLTALLLNGLIPLTICLVNMNQIIAESPHPPPADLPGVWSAAPGSAAAAELWMVLATVLSTCCLALVFVIYARRHLRRLDLQRVGVDSAHQQFNVALNFMNQGLCLFDQDQRLVVVNRRFFEITQLSETLVRAGMQYSEILTGCINAWDIPVIARRALVEERLMAARRMAPSQQEVKLPGGGVMVVFHEPVAGGGFVHSYTDITGQRQSETQIAYLATHDALTGLANRPRFRELLGMALGQRARDRVLTVLCLDLDHFKQVNETLGPQAGDALLCQLAARLQAVVREGDTVARLGGDEFAIIQNDVERIEDAATLCDRLIETVGAPFVIQNQPVVVSLSVGVAVSPADGEDRDMLLKKAAMALHRAKADGRGNFCFFEAEMDARLEARRALERELRKAIAEDGFDVHYQPQIDLITDRIVGFEALARWTHGTRGVIAPVEFIPVAEDLGLINKLGEWVMRRACREAAGWPEEIGVAVNLSVAQFKFRGLVQMVRQALADAGLPARRLELEITESLFLADDERNLQILHELRALGVRVSMDDFGTGYSSLSYLQRFPFDKIKIDRSFIQDLTARGGSAAIVRAAVVLGVSLGIRTVAEGVETREQLAKLRAEGCDEAQGYLLGRPGPAAGVPAVIAARHAERLSV
jgi:diguanylate cyclase (GGDEF)-like protein